MSLKINQKTYLVRPVPLVGLPGTVNASATLTAGRDGQSGIRTTVLTLTAQTVTASAANDYGSLLLWTFPASQVLVLGSSVALTSTQAGFASNNGTDITFALGSAAASNASLTSTMVDFVPSTAGTGTTAGTIAATSSPTEGPKFKAASTAIYFNMQNPVTTGTGTLTLTGTVKLVWMDIGSA